MDLTLKALLAEVYRKEISEKTLRAMAYKRQRGEKLGGDVPFGFEAVDGKLVADDEEQAVIRLAQEHRQRGFSLREIAGKLQQIGATTKRGLAEWNASQVQRLLARATA